MKAIADTTGVALSSYRTDEATGKAGVLPLQQERMMPRCCP
jgi:hypothetical protein